MRKLMLLVSSFVLLTMQVWAQRVVTGTVTDEQGTAIPNASVTIKGTNEGTVTANDGTFRLTLPVGSTTLVISSVNMQPMEVEVGSQNSVAVSLKALDNSLSEVVVVAYGSQKKTNITGAVNTVSGEEVAGRPFTSVDKALQGAVPGLRSASVSGAPGSATSIRIRGVGSLSASSEPLWVIDGIIATTGDLTANTTTSNALNTLNPDDIESITVLKDAAASSIYGSRAANGVILVTTKKGKAGKTRISASAEFGQNSIAFRNENNRPMTTEEYESLIRTALINSGDAADEAEADEISKTYFGYNPANNYDWYDLVTQKGNQTQYNVSVNGGNEKTQFYLSSGYFFQEGTTIASDFKRYNGAFSLTHKATDKLKLSLNINGGNSLQRTPANGGAFANPVLAAYFIPSFYPAFEDDGKTPLYDDPDGYFPTGGGIYNPLVQAAFNKSTASQTTLRGSLMGEYQILRNLKFTSRYSGEYFVVNENSYRNPFYGDGRAQGGDGFAVFSNRYNWTWSNFADYHANILNDGDLSANIKLGVEAQQNRQYQLQAGGQGFPGTLDLRYLASAATPTTASSLPSEYATNSYFSTADINYKDRYVITGSFRRDGSSVFGANYRWGNFYSVGATWNITEEDFMQNVALLSLLKLRGSYGENGNALGFGFYQALPTYSYDATYLGQPGSRPSNVGNADLTWETNKISNIGLDFGLFKNRLYGTVEVYNRTTEGLLLNKPLSLTSGFPGQLTNVGVVENKGYEISLGGRPLDLKNFTWELKFNIAHNTNKIKELYQNSPISTGFFRYTVGYDAQTFYLRQWAGVNPDDGSAQWYKDETMKEKSSYNSAALVLNHSAAPKYFGGLSSNMSFFGFSVDVQFVYNFGNYVYSTWDRYLSSDGLFYGSYNQLSSQLTAWKQPGDITNVPKIVYGGYTANSWNHSTRYLYKGDYIRLRDVQLSYSVPSAVTNRLHISNFSVYVRGTNLAIFGYDKMITQDPEAGINSTNNFDVFIPKTITAGVKIGM